MVAHNLPFFLSHNIAHKSALLKRQGRRAEARKVLADSVYHLQDSVWLPPAWPAAANPYIKPIHHQPPSSRQGLKCTPICRALALENAVQPYSTPSMPAEHIINPQLSSYHTHHHWWCIQAQLPPGPLGVHPPHQNHHLPGPCQVYQPGPQRPALSQ